MSVGRQGTGQIVLRVIIVLSFSRISLTTEKPESIQSRKNNVCFLYEMFELFHKHCFSNAILAGVSADHFFKIVQPLE